MSETTIGSQIRDPNQKFIYAYDFVKNWSWLVVNSSMYPKKKMGKLIILLYKTEGIAPSQYGTRGLWVISG